MPTNVLKTLFYADISDDIIEVPMAFDPNLEFWDKEIQRIPDAQAMTDMSIKRQL